MANTQPEAFGGKFTLALIMDTYGKGRYNSDPSYLQAPCLESAPKTIVRGSLDDLTGLSCTAAECPFPQARCTFRRS
ncbi:MAG TPA: hypothetical protein VF828_00060 [Patescibacteria group bacterium]